MPDSQAENIDRLVSMRADEVSTENAASLLLDECLVPIDRLRHTPRRVPVGRALLLHPVSQVRLFRLLLAHANSGDWRQREGDAWHPAIIRLVLVPVEQVRRDHLGIVA